MSTCIHTRHNVSVLLHHAVCPAKYRRAVSRARPWTPSCATCAWTSRPATRRSEGEITSVEIGTDRDHGHSLMPSVPTFSPTRIVRTIKSVTAREIFRRVPSVRARLGGGAFWRWGGFSVKTVGRHGGGEAIRRYVREPGREKEYRMLHSQQLELF